MARMPACVTLRGKMLPEYRSILTPEALGFLAELHRRFDGERQGLLTFAPLEPGVSARESCRIFSPDPRRPRGVMAGGADIPPICRTGGLKSPGRPTARW